MSESTHPEIVEEIGKDLDAHYTDGTSEYGKRKCVHITVDEPTSENPDTGAPRIIRHHIYFAKPDLNLLAELADMEDEFDDKGKRVHSAAQLQAHALDHCLYRDADKAKAKNDAQMFRAVWEAINEYSAAFTYRSATATSAAS